MLFASSLIPSLTKSNTIIRVVIAMQMKWWGMNYFQLIVEQNFHRISKN